MNNSAAQTTSSPVDCERSGRSTCPGAFSLLIARVSVGRHLTTANVGVVRGWHFRFAMSTSRCLLYGSGITNVPFTLVPFDTMSRILQVHLAAAFESHISLLKAARLWTTWNDNGPIVSDLSLRSVRCLNTWFESHRIWHPIS
jgi:hypothetical protein